jgi:hypothetical protein
MTHISLSIYSISGNLDNDRVTDIFTTYNVSMKEALEHEKTKNINRVSGYDAFIVTQFEYLGNIISMIVETNSFLNSIPFIEYLLREFLIV